MKLFQKVRPLIQDKCGTSVIELAIFAPFAALLLLGLADTSLLFAEKLRIEQVAQRAVEKATSYGGAGSDYSDLDDEAAAEANVPLSAVRFDKWLECDDARQSSFDSVCHEDEQIKRYIYLSINGSYTPLFGYGPLGSGVGVDDNGDIPFQVEAEVRIQ